MNKVRQQIINSIKIVKDFPKPGISFKDVTPILANPKLFKLLIKELKSELKGLKFDAIAGLESRGFWFGLPLALELGIPFLPIRKKGKLPRKTVSASYSLEYGKAAMEIHKEDVKPNDRILLVDDIIATGGTLIAAKQMMNKLKAKCNHCIVLGALDEIPEGIEKVESTGIKVHTLFKL